MTTPEARAQQIIEQMNKYWIPRMDRARGDDLAVTIAYHIRQAKAEVWAEVKQQCEIVIDMAKKGG